MLCSGQALALGCVDIPNSKVDLDLDSYLTDRNYGRLLPEFKAETKTEERQRKLPIDRLVGKRLQLEDGDGHVWLTLTKAGETEVLAVSGDQTEVFTVPAKLAGLNNAAFNGKLARTFFSLGISWRDFAAPTVPKIDLSQVPPKPTITTVAQTTISMTGTPEVERVDNVEYTCSSRAEFVGEPADLSSMVVLKGAIRARQMATTTITETNLLLTINDVVEQQKASFTEIATLLEDYPEASNVLKNVLKVDPVATAGATGAEVAVAANTIGDGNTPAAKETSGSLKSAEEAVDVVPIGENRVADIPVVVAAPATQTGAPPPEPDGPPPPGGPKWGPILATLAVIFSIVLLLLYHPRFTARRGRDRVSPAAKTPVYTEETDAAGVAVGKRGAAVSKPEPDIADTDDKVEVMVPDDLVELAAMKKATEREPKPKPRLAAMAIKMAPRVRSAVGPKVTADTDPKEAADADRKVAVDAADDAKPAASVEKDAPPKSIETRIAVLETLSAEAELFQEKLKAAIATASADAADSKVIRDKLSTVEDQLSEVTVARDKLLESNQDQRSKLNAATDEGRELKEMVIELRTRLAKANARIESSQSVIVELESASKMAIELNADYRAKSTDYITENRAMRGRVALLEASLLERDKLLKATNQTNEEISRALLDERVERAAIEEDFNALSRDHETLQQDTIANLNNASTDAGQTELELRAAQKLIIVLESELERLNEEFKQTQLTQHDKQTQNARQRVDHGVRVRLMENNVQELSAHIETLEQKLREKGLDVPDLQLTPIDELVVDDEPEEPTDKSSARFKSKEASTNIRASKRGDVLRFRVKR